MKIAAVGTVFMDCMGRPTTEHFDPRGRNVGAVDIGSLFAARTIEHVGPVRPDLGRFILEGTAV